MFPICSQGGSMEIRPEGDNLRPATDDEVAQTLAHALRYNGRKRIHTGDEYMARITSERLIEQLRQSGFVIMKKPAAAQHSSGDYMPRLKD